jgi:Carboxypeptidase regulatory-like domain/TonB dependent receptor
MLMNPSHVAAALRRLFAMLTIGLVLVAPPPLFAQASVTGSISGTVADASGALLPGVTVTVTKPETGFTRTEVSDANGAWAAHVLPVGRYTVSFELDGFKKLVRENVDVEAAVRRNVSASLEVGGVAETINVSGGAVLTERTSPTTYRQLSSEDLEKIPTGTRSFTHLLSAEAGVSSDLPPVLINGTGNISPSVNGTRTTSTSLFFNGIDVTNVTNNEGSLNDNISPAPETLQEVKLQTSLYDASTGRSGGGNFQLVTKSGTNNYHGSLYFSGQHERLNANDFFFNKDEIEKPKAQRFEEGFVVGGPIKRDRVFFFGGYQRTDAETGFVPTASSISVLPAALGRISGERTKANLLAAFASLNPGILTSIPKPDCTSPSDRACISDVALAILNLRNPVTGDFIIPAPSANATPLPGTDPASGPSVGGNPWVRQRNVQPSEYQQDQVNLKIDGQLNSNHRLSGTLFYSDFPGFDSFPDPATLVSPFTLKRADRSRVFALSETQIWSQSMIGESKFGLFYLDNNRSLDDPFLSITNEQVGVLNPATFFDSSPGTLRLGHYIGNPGTILERFSFGGPNDSFNQREQWIYSVGQTMTWSRGTHTMRFGGEYKYNMFDTSLPEEQATEFEKFENFTQFLRGLAREADTQFGITEKQFRFQDFNLFVADDWKLSRNFTLNLGLRYEFFGWPTEVDGRIGNVDFAAITNTENPRSGFIVPSNATTTGFNAIDQTLDITARADNDHTLNGADTNNFAPRLGFAWTPTEDAKLVIRGGYGIYYDRPSAAFINTVFSNYPFLREVEVTFPDRAVPMNTAYSQQDPNFPFANYLPNRVVRAGGVNGAYQIRDGTNVTAGADGTPNTTDPATGQPFRGNVAETFEFRAVDRDLTTPYYQQYNIGVQREFGDNWLVELRYVGSTGRDLLQAVAFNQGYDLNDPATPDHIYERFNVAYVAAGSPNGALNAGATARQRGVGRAFGFPNTTLPGSPVDLNIANPSGALIGFEARTPILGFNVPEAVLLQSKGRSQYHGLQTSVTKRLSNNFQFNGAYTWSRSKDENSVDPGSTAGGGKPEVPNAGFVIQGNNRDPDSNYALSDFDRTHRFAGSFVWNLPAGFRISGYGQVQSGVPYSIVAAEPELGNINQYVGSPSSLRLGSGGLYRLGFGRPSLCGSLDELEQEGEDPTEQAFNAAALCSPMTAAGGYPDNLGFGNLGRNVLRAKTQKRVDLMLAKSFTFGQQRMLELRWDVFNVFNWVNFAPPENIIGDPGTDFGKITNTVGGPRVMQFGARFVF